MSKPYVVFRTPRDCAVVLTLDTPGTQQVYPLAGPQTAKGRDDAHVAQLPDDTPLQGALQQTVWPGGYLREGRGILHLSPDGSEFLFQADDEHLIKDRPFDPFRLPRLVKRGAFYGLDTGERFTGIEISSFNLFARWRQEGPDAVEPVMQELQDLGFNMVRVWTNMRLAQYGIGDFIPTEDDYRAIPSFCGHCALHGLYIEFTAYTSDPGRQDRSHWTRLGQAARGASNTILELVNENDIAVNTIDTTVFQPIPGVLCSHGSNGSGAWPVEPSWDIDMCHYNLESEWQRKVGHNTMEAADAHGTIGHANENPRYPDNQQSPTKAYDAAAAGALLTGATCFHCVSGKRSSLLMPGDELEGARQWAAGARSVPLEFQDGVYIRHDPGPYLRVYERRLADGRGHVVNIRA